MSPGPRNQRTTLPQRRPPAARVRAAGGATNRRLLLLLAAMLVLGVGSLLLWRAGEREPLAEFRTFPYTYITEQAAGYDDTAVLIDRGTITGAPSIESAGGARAWPAYTHPDLPRKDGRAYIFPLILDGTVMRTPVIAPLHRPLTRKEIDRVERFQTAEGEERMEEFRKGLQR